MTGKRFTIHKESKYKEEWYAYPFCIKEEGEVVLETIPLSIAEKVRDKLNEQQATINKLEQENRQLRHFINKGRRLSVKEIMNNTNENELLKKKIKELEKENKELQKYKNKNEMIDNG